MAARLPSSSHKAQGQQVANPVNAGENNVTATETQGDGGTDDLSSMHKIVCQLAEMLKQDIIMEERYKAKVVELQNVLAIATSSPQEEVGQE